MTKQIATLILIIICSTSLAGVGFPYNGILSPDIEKPEYLITNRVLIEMNVALSEIGPIEILNDPNNTVYKRSKPQGGNNWVSKTISIVGRGFDLAGLNIKMNKFDLVKKSGWINQKEWNLNADKTRNGLSIKYKF